MKKLSKFLAVAMFIVIGAVPAYSLKTPWDEGGCKFVVKIKRIEVGNDHVRVVVNSRFYGTCAAQGCPENENTFGWPMNNPHHTTWMNMVMTAQLANAGVEIWQKQASTCGAHYGMQIGMIATVSE